MADCDPIIVGGQSVNLWAQHYVSKDPSLVAQGPLTSKDLDIFINPEAAKRLAHHLVGGQVLLPGIDDSSANAALVVGTFGTRRITVDFMAKIIGVDDASVKNKYVVLEGMIQGRVTPVKLLLMNPLDCVLSRFANINVLHRHEDQSLRQAEISLKVLRLYIDNLISMGEFRLAQSCLRNFEFAIKDQHIGKDSHILFGHRLDVFATAETFIKDDRLDLRWRERILAKILSRLRQRAEGILARRRLAQQLTSVAPSELPSQA